MVGLRLGVEVWGKAVEAAGGKGELGGWVRGLVEDAVRKGSGGAVEAGVDAAGHEAGSKGGQDSNRRRSRVSKRGQSRAAAQTAPAASASSEADGGGRVERSEELERRAMPKKKGR